MGGICLVDFADFEIEYDEDGKEVVLRAEGWFDALREFERTIGDVKRITEIEIKSKPLFEEDEPFGKDFF